MTSTRPNQHAWVTAFQNQPPAACATLRALSNSVEYGVTCVFGEEDGDPLPNSINTACLPWATGSVPPPSAFYSPATACPTSWTAISTRTSADGANDWIDGETTLECCPPGFVGGAGGMCNPENSGTTPVVRCGEADAEENENVVYSAGNWPASVTAQVTALQLRYQPSDVGSTARVSATSSSTSTSTSTSGPGSETGSNGLSTGAKAAIGTIIPLVFILGALAAFMLWRRRKHRNHAAAVSKDMDDGHETKQSYEQVPQNTYLDSKGPPATMPATVPGTTHETPEWNAELDATEAERRRYMAVQGSLFPPASGTQAMTSSPGGASEASELGGMMRVGRKPVAPVELDSTPMTTELQGSDHTERR
jgi:hypothetical protein